MLDAMLGWESYERKPARFADKKTRKKLEEMLAWNRGEQNGYDLTEVLVPDFNRKHCLEDLAISEVLWSEGAEGVGAATVFFSHCQNMPLPIMLQTLQDSLPIYREQLGEEPCFFVDYFCIRQCHKVA